MEDLILAAAIKSREAFDKIGTGVKFNEMIAKTFGWVTLCYSRDKAMESIPKELLVTYAQEHSQNPKHVDLFTRLIDRCYSADVSVANVLGLLKERRTEVLAMELVEASSKRDAKRVAKLIDQLTEPEPDEETDILQASDITSLVARRLNQDNLIKVAPATLNDYIGGGMLGGHHLMAFGRPEIGKSAFGLTNAACFIKQRESLTGLGIYVINEDRKDDLELRLISCITGVSAQELRDEAKQEEAQARLDKYNYRNRILFAECHPGNLKDIANMCKTHKPNWMVVDQLRNLSAGKSESNVQRLDSVGQGFRDILKEYNVAGISLTQAGDSASNDLVLDMSDIDSSKTGLPASCDVLVGIGANEDFLNVGQRMLSVCKNKMPDNKGHGHFPVQYIRQFSKLQAL